MPSIKTRKFICATLSLMMFLGALPAEIHAENDTDTVLNDSYEISGEITEGVLNAVITDKIGTDSSRAYIAEYNGDKLVKLTMKSDLRAGANEIVYTLDDNTDAVKIFLWKDEMTPVVGALKKQ